MSLKIFEGTVVSNKMQKTLVVLVDRKYREKKLGKILSTRKKYKVHCDDSTVKEGDSVAFIECRPLSKDKKFRLSKVLKRIEVAAQTQDEVST
jgi:small subunit ribosomal protein S17